ncbi:MAG TPA: MaoC/PaaZ C-terminal domain-containing protein [Solirubrobacterales bacterium]|nr:MaoC/PaaZ C-terminal domain-containing protein [Solirubrobacterales bacterium]
MTTRVLDSSPSILPLYARAAAPMIPGAALLPFVPGRGKEIPDLELSLAGVRAEAEKVAAYARVCGFTLRGHLPPTYPHILAFPLHMAVMADGSFPFGAVGLVHVENGIVQHRPVGLDEELSIRVRPTKLQPHPRGHSFAIVTEVRAGAETVWESTSTFLRRGKPSPAPDSASTAPPSGDSADSPSGGISAAHQVEHGIHGKRDALDDSPPASGEWRLPGDLGRRYGGVSGDRNPIHMHSLTAKPLGFPGAIAHGMWTKARCLAALESRLPDSFSVDVRFRKPIVLPARVEFASTSEGEEIAFAVRDAKRQTPHLDGRLRPLEAKSKGKPQNVKSKEASPKSGPTSARRKSK